MSFSHRGLSYEGSVGAAQGRLVTFSDRKVTTSTPPMSTLSVLKITKTKVVHFERRYDVQV